MRCRQVRHGESVLWRTADTSPESFRGALQLRIHSKLCEKAAQQVDAGLRSRIELNFLNIREFAAVREYDAINRAIG